MILLSAAKVCQKIILSIKLSVILSIILSVILGIKLGVLRAKGEAKHTEPLYNYVGQMKIENFDKIFNLYWR